MLEEILARHAARFSTASTLKEFKEVISSLAAEFRREYNGRLEAEAQTQPLVGLFVGRYEMKGDDETRLVRRLAGFLSVAAVEQAAYKNARSRAHGEHGVHGLEIAEAQRDLNKGHTWLAALRAVGLVVGWIHGKWEAWEAESEARKYKRKFSRRMKAIKSDRDSVWANVASHYWEEAARYFDRRISQLWGEVNAEKERQRQIEAGVTPTAPPPLVCPGEVLKIPVPSYAGDGAGWKAVLAVGAVLIGVALLVCFGLP